ncbi:SDR family oxidoreductase [Actibacterium sp. MT2.3-13A]|uniref:SDR family NAD(P)-dependent oxidoreductase n=1 Tax=Actibacterium sp. MT2.3-13A TaxID=2828332 RepID=UPI001BAB3D5F|nr:SDR family oxidoreductase [Actibacterium sp. MT2.3-13A]
MGFSDFFRLDGKKLFITGGSRGLGREMALAIAAAGADVALVARPSESLENTAKEIRELGRTAWTFEADIGDPAACEAACAEALDAAGPFDILINNVGGRRVNVPTEDMPLDQWRELMDLNLTSTFLCCKAIGGAMIARGAGGRVINIASINALVAGRGLAGRHYETAKAGVLQLTRSLAVDWAPHGITVNAICPGIFLTEPNKLWSQKHPEVIEGILRNIPQGRLGDPRDIGPLAVYLASDSASYMTGASLVIDGGYTCW